MAWQHVLVRAGLRKQKTTLILLIAFVIVGPQDLPRVVRWLGKGLRKTRQLVAELKAESGLGDLEAEIRDIKKEAGAIRQDADITREIRQAGESLRQSAREIEETVTAKDVQQQAAGEKKEE